MSADEKPIFWVGSAKQDLIAFPTAAVRAAGHNLSLVQNGLMPGDFKPMENVGPGTYEIRIRTDEGAGQVQHRVFFVAKFAEGVDVLLAFRKPTQQTSRHDVEVGRQRCREPVAHRRELRKQRAGGAHGHYGHHPSRR
ncbi:MAG: phage-related protein [Gemmatimonadetes bacterium]|nr:phage-related protein [Gemmatimonadota bacterium]